MSVRVVVTHSSGTVIARESFGTVDEANQWLEDQIGAGRFGANGRWIDETDVAREGHELVKRAVYSREFMGHKEYYVTGDYNINLEPM